MDAKMSNPHAVDIDCHHEDYFELIKQYLLAQAALLNDTLKECDVASAAQRMQICKQFGCAIGALFDQKWIKVNDRQYFPMLMFSEKFLAGDLSLQQVGAVLGPNKVDDLLPLGIWAGRTLFDEFAEELPVDAIGLVGDS